MKRLRSGSVAATGLIAVAGALIWLSVVWGRRFQERKPEIKLGAAPFVGRSSLDGWDWRAHWQLALPIAVAAVVIFGAQHVISCWRLRWVLLSTGLAAGAFGVALALGDGVDGLFYGATHKTEYLANLPKTREWHAFVNTFVERLPYYSVHVRGHPPGFVLVLKMAAGLGLHGAWPAVALSIVGVVITPIAVLVAVQRLAGDIWARRAAPFQVLVPYAIWQVTSADAFFMAVAATAVALLAIAVTTTRWRAVGASLLGGVVLGCSMFLTYGTIAFLVVPGAVVLSTWRQWRRLALVTLMSGLGVAVVVVAFWLLGFWWLEGFAALRGQYWAGTAKFRTWTYFLLANTAVTLIVVGPAVLWGVVRLRSRGLWILFGAAVVAIVGSQISQFSKGEVERIWLLFYPWLMLAAAPLASLTGAGRLRLWLAIQAALAITLQSWLVTKW